MLILKVVINHSKFDVQSSSTRSVETSTPFPLKEKAIFLLAFQDALNSRTASNPAVVVEAPFPSQCESQALFSPPEGFNGRFNRDNELQPKNPTTLNTVK